MYRNWGKLDAENKKELNKNKTEGYYWDDTLYDKIKMDQKKSHSIFAKSSFTTKEQQKSFNLTPQKDKYVKQEEDRRIHNIEQRQQEEKAKRDKELDAKYSRWQDNDRASFSYSLFGNKQTQSQPYKDSFTKNSTNQSWSHGNDDDDDPTRGFFQPKPKKGFFF